MKKTRLLVLTALLFGFAFVACQKEPEGPKDEPKKTSQVTEVSTTDVAVVNNQPAAQKTTVKDVAQFNEVVLPAIAEQVGNIASAIFAENSNESKGTVNFAREAETLTVEALNKAFEEFPKKLQESANINQEEMKASIDFDWNGPTGNIETGVTGAEASISALDVKIKGSLNVDKETQKINVSGDASGNAAGSLSANIPADFGADGLKNIKLNVLAKVNAENIAIVGNPELLAMANSMDDETDGENKDEPEIDPATLFDSVSGKLYLYAGVSGASYFEVKGTDSNEYNGVIKATISLSIDESLSKDKIISIFNTLEALDSNESGISGKDIDKLPVSINIAISVYDVSGKKLFDYLTVDSFAKLEETVKQFMPQEA